MNTAHEKNTSARVHLSSDAMTSLEFRRQEICEKLHENRQALALQLVGSDRHDQFPRSAAMRFISNHSTREILHKAANAALGLQTFRALRWGLGLVRFIGRGFTRK